MSEVERNEIIDEVCGVEEVQEERTGLLTNVKNAISGKIANIKEDHPKGCKIVKTTIKVIGYTLGAAACVLVGASLASKDPGDYPGYDDETSDDISEGSEEE